MKAVSLAILLSIILLSSTILAGVPSCINYQGTLTDGDGAALDTTLSMVFSIYTDSTGGSQVWTETQPTVTVSNGLFTVLLGRVNVIPDMVFNSPSRWLGIQVGSDPEMVPRQRIASMAYAFRAAQSDTADYARNAPGVSDADWIVSGNDMYSAVSGNVGIGTTSPASKLDVQGTFNTGSDGTGYDVNLYGANSGSRLFWDEDKMAFRAGIDTDGTHWDPGSVGQYSFATGVNATASGGYSSAMGYYATASGPYSTALGYSTIANGYYSLAAGRYVTAQSDTTIIFGSGESAAYRLINDVPNSFMVGFNTTTPTLFVGGSNHFVGIGTTSPGDHLDVNGDVRVRGADLKDAGGTARVTLTDNGRLDLKEDGGTEALSIATNGHVGIGTTSPSYKLDVRGERIQIREDASGDWIALRTDGGGLDFEFQGGPLYMQSTVSGEDILLNPNSGNNVGVGLTLPNRKLYVVENVDTLSYALKLDNPNSSYANGVGILFSTGGNGVNGLERSRGKGALVYELNSTWNRGKFHFLQDTGANSNNPDLADAVMTVQNNGNVGIGTTSPARKLHVAGDAEIDNDIFIDGQVGVGTTNPVGTVEAVTSSDSCAMYAKFTGTWGYGLCASNSTGHTIVRLAGFGGGVYGEQDNALTAYGYGLRGESNATNGIGVDGRATGANSYGVYGDGGAYGVYGNSSVYAGYFNGDVHIAGNLTGGKTVIDHPLDPENKLLRHNLVESPENLLIYRGKIRLDGGGQATIEMSDYFATLTRESEATVHLTPIGKSPSAEKYEFSYEWESGHQSFVIFGEPEREVAWMVMADRDDPVMRLLAQPVEEAKGPDNKLCDRGKLLYPSAYGYPESMGRDYLVDEMRKQLKELTKER